MNQTPVILASASPRRAELLTQIGVEFRVHPVAIDESRRSGEQPDVYVCRVALDKARAASQQLGPEGRSPVLAADTAVVVDDEVLGKPRDRADARRMLTMLSGRNHSVMSAVAVVADDNEHCLLSTSDVTFRQLDDAEIDAYWDSGEPADKAGAYAIQGHAAVFVKRLEGSYSGVMGLPLYETAQLLGQTEHDTA